MTRVCQKFLICHGDREFKQRFSKIVLLIEIFSLMTISKCPLSILKRCPFYRGFQHSKTFGTHKKCPSYRDVHLTEVSVKRELTVFGILNFIDPKCMSVKNRGKKLPYFAWVHVDEQLSKGFGNNNYVTLKTLSRDSSRGINRTKIEPGKGPIA